jgi:TRAP-type C4-dicarboxylate transport system substrate-binding protein
MHVLVALVILKIASLAPEGSSWLKLFHQWQRNVETRSAGRLVIKLYPGGVQGDEKDMLRKIRSGALAGAAITAIGLSTITPEVRVLEVCRDYAELDHARDKLDPLLRRAFERRGFVLVGWGDVGPVHLFSQVPMRSLEDLQKGKLWLFNDDPLTRRGFEALGLHGSPLSIPEVLPALSTHLIDTYVGAPLSTLVLQWYRHSRYMTSAVIGQATGAIVIGKPQWEALDARDREILTTTGREMQAAVTAQVRADNEQAWHTLQAEGIQVVPISPAFERDIMMRMSRMALANMDLVLAEIDRAVARMGGAAADTREFQVAVRALLEEYRGKYPGLGDVLDEYDRRHAGAAPAR